MKIEQTSLKKKKKIEMKSKSTDIHFLSGGRNKTKTNSVSQ